MAAAVLFIGFFGRSRRMNDRRMLTLVIVGILLVVGLMTIVSMVENPTTIPHSGAEAPITNGR